TRRRNANPPPPHRQPVRRRHRARRTRADDRLRHPQRRLKNPTTQRSPSMAIEYADIAPHIALTDQQIRDALNADMRLVRDAQIQPLQRLMVRSGMVRSVGFAGATGIIAGLYDTFNDEGKRIADEFLVALVSPFPYPCSQPAEGTVLVQVNTIANANAGQLLNGYTAQSFTAELTAITGGRKYGTVTTQQVTDVRAAEAA